MSDIKKNILIIGAGDAGKLIAKDINDKYKYYNILGYIDDKVKTSLSYPILGKISDLAKVISVYNIDELLIAIPSSDGKLVRNIIMANLENSIKLKIVPRKQKILRGNKVTYKDLETIQLEDFIGRRVFKHDIKLLNDFYKDKTVFITGGAGSIGSEIVKQLIEIDAKKIIVLDNSEYLLFNLEQSLIEDSVKKEKYELIIGSVLNKRKIEAIVIRNKPDVIIHAAAYKHVYLMENNPDEAIVNNIIGSKNVIDTAVELAVPNFLFISTDKVVNPTNIMGATKKITEFYIQTKLNSKTNFNIVRFGNVINSNGSVLPTFLRQIKERKYVTVTDPKILRFFMSLREASILVISTLCKPGSGNIYILNMGELIPINEIALCTIRSLNYIPNKDIEVRYIGLKKGEKLYEELFTDKEKKNLKTLEDDSIFRIIEVEDPPKNIEKFIEELHEISFDFESRKSIKHKLLELFPSLK